MLEVVSAVLLAAALNRFLPERLRIDPFVWYRDWLDSIEHRFNDGSKMHGVTAVALAIIPVIVLLWVLRFVFAELGWGLRFVFDVVVLAWCIPLYRISDRAREIADALGAGDMPVANENLRLLSGEGADELSESAVAQTAVEAVLERGNAVLIAPLLWFVLLGPSGAVLQRLASVSHGSWNPSEKRFAEFGRGAARLDEVLGWVPARLTAFSYAIMGSFEDALHCWRYQVGMWSGSNTAVLLAAGFGAMQMQSCESVSIEGQAEKVSVTTVVPDGGHVARSIALLWRVLAFWLAIASAALVLQLGRL